MIKKRLFSLFFINPLLDLLAIEVNFKSLSRRFTQRVPLGIFFIKNEKVPKEKLSLK